MKYSDESADAITIPFNKHKMVAVGMLAIVFAVVAAIVWTQEGVFVKAVAVAAILLSAASLIFITLKLFNGAPAIMITNERILDHSSAASIGWIKWADVTGFRELKISNQKMIVVILSDPEKYMQGLGGIKARLARANIAMFGSPVVISPNTTAVNYEEMFDLFLRAIERSRVAK